MTSLQQSDRKKTPRPEKRQPERTCVGCRSPHAPHDMLRLVCTPHGEVRLDRTGRLPGRGAYVCCHIGCFRKALKPARLATSFRRPVKPPSFDTIHQTALALLSERLGACLSMAQRAGAAVSGHTALQKALNRASIICLVFATDMAPARAAAYRSRCVRQHIPYVTLFTKEEIGRLIGRENRSAVGLTDPRFCELLCTTMAALKRLDAAYDDETC
jgi:predicted RNA-binding protein YlxR (DUF448 family)